MEQRAQGTLQVWAEPFVALRRPEALQPAHRSVRARRHHLEHLLGLVPRPRLPRARGHGDRGRSSSTTFKEFPPRQKAASFTIDQAVAEAAKAGRVTSERHDGNMARPHRGHRGARSRAATFAWARTSTTRRRRPSTGWRSTGSGSIAAPVTNGEFAAFVAATPATSRSPSVRSIPADFPGAPAENLVPGSLVFTGTTGPGRPAPPAAVVDVDAGRVWRHPEGRRSDVADRERIPSSTSPTRTPRPTPRWAGRRCRPRPSGSSRRAAGSTEPTFTWGDEPRSPGERRWRTIWHGDFPWQNRSPTASAERRRSAHSRQRLRPLRHGRQRVGVDRRLVHGPTPRRRRTSRAACPRTPRRHRARQPRSRPAAVPRSRARSSRAARSSAPTATACATGRPRASRR